MAVKIENPVPVSSLVVEDRKKLVDKLEPIALWLLATIVAEAIAQSSQANIDSLNQAKKSAEVSRDVAGRVYAANAKAINIRDTFEKLNQYMTYITVGTVLLSPAGTAAMAAAKGASATVHGAVKGAVAAVEGTTKLVLATGGIATATGELILDKYNQNITIGEQIRDQAMTAASSGLKRMAGDINTQNENSANLHATMRDMGKTMLLKGS